MRTVYLFLASALFATAAWRWFSGGAGSATGALTVGLMLGAGSILLWLLVRRLLLALVGTTRLETCCECGGWQRSPRNGVVVDREVDLREPPRPSGEGFGVVAAGDISFELEVLG